MSRVPPCSMQKVEAGLARPTEGWSGLAIMGVQAERVRRRLVRPIKDSRLYFFILLFFLFEMYLYL